MNTDKLELLAIIIEQYKLDKDYSLALYKIKQMESDTCNYLILCDIFDEAITII